MGEAVKIRDLEYFVAVAREKSISKAAASLYIAQPALSRKLKELETIFGVKLFVRTRDGITLTEEGEIFYSHARELLALYQKLVSTMKKGYTGTLRIGFILGLRYSYFVDAVDKMRREYPGSDIQLIPCTDGVQLVEKLLSWDIDCGVCSSLYVESYPELDKKILVPIRTYAVVSPLSPLAQLKEVSLQQLQGDTLIFPPAHFWPAHVSLLEGLVKESGLPLKVRYAESLDSLQLMVECGEGVGFLAGGSEVGDARNLAAIPLKEDVFPRYRVVTWLKNNNNSGIEIFSKVIESTAKKM